MPFTAINTSQDIDIYLASATDLTGRVIAFRVRTTAATAGGFQVFAKNGEALEYAYVKSGWHDFSTTSSWTDVTLDLSTATPDASNMAFDVAQISIITLQLHAGGGEAPSNPTVAQVDSVTLTPAATVGPWPFTADASALNLSSYMPVAGSAVTFVAAETL